MSLRSGPGAGADTAGYRPTVGAIVSRRRYNVSWVLQVQDERVHGTQKRTGNRANGFSRDQPAAVPISAQSKTYATTHCPTEMKSAYASAYALVISVAFFLRSVILISALLKNDDV